MESSNRVDDQLRGIFKLPAELRNAIYSLAVCADKPINLYRMTVGLAGNTKLHLRSDPSVPCIIYASRQIRDEALPLYLGANTFRVPQFSLADISGPLAPPSAFAATVMKHMKHCVFFNSNRYIEGPMLDVQVQDCGSVTISSNDDRGYTDAQIDSLQDKALQLAREHGGQMGLAFAVMKCFAEEHVHAQTLGECELTGPIDICMVCGCLI